MHNVSTKIVAKACNLAQMAADCKCDDDSEDSSDDERESSDDEPVMKKKPEGC